MNDKQEKPPSKEEKKDAIVKASESIELAIERCGVMAVRKLPPLLQAIQMASGIRAIRNNMPKQFIEEHFAPMQNTTLGFLTDKPEGYPWEVVRDVLCEALLRGFRPVGNEFNIIAGKFYGAKNGYERLVQEFPGLTKFRFELAVPAMSQAGALVAGEAWWVLDGQPDRLVCKAPAPNSDEMDTRIPVKVHSGMGPDAILGKAHRKLHARVYARLTGCANSVVDADTDEMPPVELPAPATPAQDGRRIKLGGKNGNTQAPPNEYVDPETGEVFERPPEREPGVD